MKIKYLFSILMLTFISSCDFEADNKSRNVSDGSEVGAKEQQKSKKMDENKFCYSSNANGISETINFHFNESDKSISGNGNGELDQDGINWSYSFLGKSIDLKNYTIELILDTENGPVKETEHWDWSNKEFLKIIEGNRGKKRSMNFSKTECK